MYWSAEEFVLVITGILFLAIVASSFLSRVELTPMSRATFAIGAAMFIGSAASLARIESVRYPPFLWLLPLIPLLVIAVLVRDALMASRTRVEEAPAVTVRRASAFVSRPEDAYAEAPAMRVLRERAADPAVSAQELASIAYAHPAIRPTVAGNPSAPANLLEWLASAGDPAIHAAIAARPQSRAIAANA